MTKSQRYQEIKREIVAVLCGEFDLVAKMSTVACLLSQGFDDYFWTGFYLVDQHKKSLGIDELVIGPYQGSLGCLRIAFSRGVCGAAASLGKTQIVRDVHDFEGHIACDSRSQSEIVVPVFAEDGTLMGVFDVDSTKIGTFDEHDAKGLEDIMRAVFIGEG